MIENEIYNVIPRKLEINGIMLYQDEKILILETNSNLTTIKRLSNNEIHKVSTMGIKIATEKI